MSRSRVSCDRRARRPLASLACAAWLLGLCVATPAWGGPPPGFPPALAGWVESNIHPYADAAACQYGGGESKYLPDGIKPPGTLIPIMWNGKQVTWKVVDGTAGTGEFLFDGKSGVDSGDAEIVAAANARGSRKFDDPGGDGLKCDHWPYVAPSCIPGQYVIERRLDGIVWQILFRRTAAAAITAAPRAGTCSFTVARTCFSNGDCPLGETCVGTNWGRSHALYYDVVDAEGLDLAKRAADDKHFNGVTWLDALADTGTMTKGPGGARDATNGFANGQDVPRPGGKHPFYRTAGVRASKWFDSVETMRGGRCDTCHGTPFNGTDWLTGSGLTDLKDDDAKPYWHPGNEVLGFLPEKTFFKTAMKGGTGFRCGSCHKLWMQNSGTTPGEGGGGCSVTTSRPCLANADCPAGELCIPRAIPVAKIMTTLQTNPLASSFRTDDAVAFATKDASKTLQMPDPMDVATIGDWETKWRADYNTVSCCEGLAAPGAACAGVTCEWTAGTPPVTGASVSKPDFYTPWMKKQGFVPSVPPANGKQEIQAPDEAKATFMLIPCPPRADGGPDPTTVGPQDKCYQLKWQDTDNPFNAAPQWFWIKQDKSVLDMTAWPIEKDDSLYCPRVPQRQLVPYSKITQLGPDADNDRWRFEYQSIGVLKWCQKTVVRFCGGWCEQDTNTNRDPNARQGLQAATDRGQLLDLANGGVKECAPTATSTATLTATPTATNSSSPTSTPTVTKTVSPAAIATETQTPPATETRAPTATLTPSRTPTETATPMPTASETSTATGTPAATETSTPIETMTPTPIEVPTATVISTPPTPMPCTPQTCGQFTPDCDPIIQPCFCHGVAEGGGACVDSFDCGTAEDCPNGTSDCPAGKTCYVGTCCGPPKCGPQSCTGAAR